MRSMSEDFSETVGKISCFPIMPEPFLIMKTPVFMRKQSENHRSGSRVPKVRKKRIGIFDQRHILMGTVRFEALRDLVEDFVSEYTTLVFMNPNGLLLKPDIKRKRRCTVPFVPVAASIRLSTRMRKYLRKNSRTVLLTIP